MRPACSRRDEGSARGVVGLDKLAARRQNTSGSKKDRAGRGTAAAAATTTMEPAPRSDTNPGPPCSASFGQGTAQRRRRARSVWEWTRCFFDTFAHRSLPLDSDAAWMVPGKSPSRERSSRTCDSPSRTELLGRLGARILDSVSSNAVALEPTTEESRFNVLLDRGIHFSLSSLADMATDSGDPAAR
mgnify:CR=1 FL=1|jgi:hypothetical protein